MGGRPQQDAPVPCSVAEAPLGRARDTGEDGPLAAAGVRKADQRPGRSQGPQKHLHAEDNYVNRGFAGLFLIQVPAPESMLSDWKMVEAGFIFTHLKTEYG